jgi:tape measure domain-containing protein
MAESVARVRILAQIEGLEGFDKLKGAFKGLQQAIGPAESELAKARKSILEFGEAGTKSQQVIKGQIDALKALQAQATIGGTVYRQLGKDVKALGGAYQEAATGVKQFSEAQLRTQAASNKPSLFQNQIAALKRDLNELDVLAQEYANSLADIQRREIRFGMGAARQGVIARNQAFEDDNFLLPDRLNGQPELPNTTAALNQRVTELSDRLNNLTYGGERWIQTSREIAQIQRRLNQEFANPAVEAARRRLEASRNTSSGFLAFSQGLEDRLAVQKSIERNRRRQPGPLYDAPIGPPPPSELFRSIGGISGQMAANQAQLMGRSYQEVATRIRETARASDGSIGSLQRQRESWEQLRATISPLDREYAQIERQARRAVAAIDQQIGRRQIGGRGGAAEIGQGTGALAASGIFGGPEGFLGSALGGGIGALLGGPAGFATGTFIGGSAGAYGSMARQSLGTLSDYAAQLEKQRIALQGVAGSAEEYRRALSAAQSASDQFNVPIGETTQSMTQLSAAVIGAGGRVADAELVFKNITTAIKATGGGAEQVQGSLTAMAQIFSKGKVSAEELQGQLGERLPGAVTAFAEATGRTLPQLQKDLEQGVVGLNDVMKFVISLGDRYADTAKKIANSDADAGQRFQKTLADFRATIGKELVPIGAELQNAFSDLLKEITPSVISIAKGLAQAIKAIVDNAGAIANLVKFAAQMGAITLAMKAFIALRPAISAMFAIVQLGSTQTALAAAMATPKLVALGAALKSLSLIGIITVGVNVVTRGIEQVKQVRDALKSLREYDPNETFAGSTRETVQGAIGQARKDLRKFQGELGELQGRAWQTWLPGSTVLGFGPGDFNAQKKLLETNIKRAQKTIDSLDPLKFPTELEVQKKELERMQKELTKFDEPQGKEKTDNALAEAERLAAEQQRIDEALARNAIELDNERFRNRQDLLRREFEFAQDLAARENELWANTFLGRGSESARAVAELFNKLSGYNNNLFGAMQGYQQAGQNLASSRALEGVTSQGLAGGAAPSGSGAGVGKLSSQGRALVAAAQKLGVSPLDLATIIGFETGGSYNPSKWGGAGGNYMGLIQFGPNERKAYGAYEGQSFEEQVMGPVVRYFKDRFAKVGMSTQGADLLTLYRTVLGGNPKASLSGRDSFGTSPQSGVARMAPHRAEATRRFFGGSEANIPSMATGIPAQFRRDISAEGQVSISQEQVDYQKKLYDFEKKRIEGLKSFDFIGFNQQVTRSIEEQNLSLTTNLEQYALKTQLEAQGMQPELVQAELDKAKAYREQAELLAPLREALKVVDDPKTKKAIEDSIENINALYADQISLVDQLAQAQTAQGATLAAYIGQLRLQLQEMTNIENIAISMGQTIESEISNAMSSAVSSVISGSGSVKEALANMFKNIGQSFVQMAMQIIAKQMVMVVLQSILKSLGAVSGVGGGAASWGGSGFNPAAFSMPALAANGATFANGTAKFAKGGIVSRPTFFKFANGGTMQNGVMGEAGPEAIVPLKRGFDGRLGIAQVRSPQGGDRRMREMMGRSPAQQQAPTLNLKFETTKINGVEYVSKDQLELAMAQTRRQAASDGAKRGMNMTLDKIQNSPSTRSRIGVR